ncbi:flagellar hook-associated protein FlgK [Sphingomonas nostoxanthinifaciens]|uniref:flagellar hook-associated protein FlgK n=1 Tax=Sphingomonas nostoxanthinifaciens TaxID=2872652 RepID=UPI001CC1DA11|nr:flagellar hook-associated protein FlgK [Sphingomonas nostoxanthinifaciens]UAK26063.1 flagellar hook-associated protein FlgK [Sphingomonas nostoxanthinifaciens]
MSDLISIGRSGINAYQGALAAVGENVTNANTDGYAKRIVTLKEQATNGIGFLSTTHADFNGVQQTTVARAFDLYKSSDAWTANSDSSYADTRAQYLTTVQSQLNDTNTGIGTKLTAIYTAANALSANPTDTTLRQSMLYAVQDATGSLGQAAASLDKVMGTISDQATSQVAQLNTSLTQLAKLNLSLETAQAGTSGRATLEDQRDSLISTISSTVGVDVTLDQKGAATLKLSNYGGPTLVSANSTTPALVSVSQSSDGHLVVSLTSNNTNSIATPTSGTLAGLMDGAGNASDRKGQLDGLADQLATQLNTWQAQGLDLSGVAGTDMLSGHTAETLQVLITDPTKIAAADATASNGNLLALQSTRSASGVETTWHAMVNAQALQVNAANTASTTASAQKDNAYSALDSVSGVSLDDQAADLLRFQQAYSASSKIIQAAKDTFQAILGLFP